MASPGGIRDTIPADKLLRNKADYVKNAGLGGVMFWELSADTADHVLVNTLYEQLNAH